MKRCRCDCWCELLRKLLLYRHSAQGVVIFNLRPRPGCWWRDAAEKGACGAEAEVVKAGDRDVEDVGLWGEIEPHFRCETRQHQWALRQKGCRYKKCLRMYHCYVEVWKSSVSGSDVSSRHCIDWRYNYKRECARPWRSVMGVSLRFIQYALRSP